VITVGASGHVYRGSVQSAPLLFTWETFQTPSVS
jgi:hypothetical protein